MSKYRSDTASGVKITFEIDEFVKIKSCKG